MREHGGVFAFMDVKNKHILPEFILFKVLRRRKKRRKRNE